MLFEALPTRRCYVFVMARIYACLRTRFEMNYYCNLFDIVRHEVQNNNETDYCFKVCIVV